MSERRDCDILAGPRKGRGAVSNPDGRYESHRHERVADDWPGDDEVPPPLRTTLGIDTARSVIAYNDSPDVAFDRSVNPYRGCEHGCSYCFARPSHAYLGLSPGLDFETRLFHKPDAPARLAEELRAPRYACAPIALGINTDAYQPVERRSGLTRRLIEVLRAYRHPVSIVTKSALVERDLDLLSAMAAEGLAQVFLSITTLDPALARALEPRAATPLRRLETLARLSEAGVPCGVLFAPVIPALNDHELERVLARAREAGASAAGYVMLRLPGEVKPLFAEWLETHVPGRAAHVFSLLRQMHGGREYAADFGVRMRGRGAYAELVAQRFRVAARREGLDRGLPPLDCSRFRVPARAGDQFDLFSSDDH
ncbi:PA0069 family radical SAM protein [Acidihalobacter prosperus]|uniref:Radical SAM domain protein n=1 Tax=Acidihalobacter prosperus TaxID=160660 RepID=A0A1A6C5D3_9GAMM|nr:PA0069 family radical SAM protein [Acidihalobacter prosperus]OBS09781.1 Radical SAM domain protein [Acidihalobacter prosperus]